MIQQGGPKVVTRELEMVRCQPLDGGVYRREIADARMVWPNDAADKDGSDDADGYVDETSPGEEEGVTTW